MEKRCFKCGKVKPLFEFYSHPMMRDEHLNKCKECTKRDVSERVKRLEQNPEWMLKERQRHRAKQERYRALGLACLTKPEYRERWELKNGHKRKAELIAGRAYRDGLITKPTTCEQCGTSGVRLEKHHDDYSQPLNVRWLCCKCHGATRHKSIVITA